MSASSSSVKKLAIRGAIWTIIGYGTSQVVRFVSNIVLTSLLVPELFGLMSLVYVFITGLHLFSDLGINANVVQSKRGDDPAFLNTAWTVQVLRGVGLWVCCLFIAFPASQIYKTPELLWLIPIVGIATLLNGFNSTAIFSLNRHLSVRQLALYELGGQVTSISVTLIWAAISPSIWALIVGNFVSASFQLFWSHRLNSIAPNRFTWEPKAVKELISFGKWIFVSTVLTFLATQADRLILGTLFTLQLLGIYHVAYALSDIPRGVLLAISGKVIYPAYSKFVDLPRDEFRAKILRNRGPILIAAAFGLAALVGFSDIVVKILYRESYSVDASWMVPLLSMGLWPIMLTQTIDPALIAIGKPSYNAFASFTSFLVYAIGIPFGFYSPLGEVGAVLAVALSNIPIWCATAYGLWREKLPVFRQDALSTALFLAILSVLAMIRNALGLGLPFEGLFTLQ
ncbi:MAG: oligosaccharide flippase family protein [Cyanobacteria bacterium CRU_2_1]|nr:oligosaccharide flippase family protein [Cyanobacteria bacterium RU_5_0]NJR58866.1 oligosaccharide flippase family protein [Cyanobacteria bacterium CRU_2_1]